MQHGVRLERMARPNKRRVLQWCTAWMALGVLYSGCELEEKAGGEPAVTTLNSGYNRVTSRVLVRRIAHPTRAHLDYAAYYANVVLYDTADVKVSLPKKIALKDLGFDGALDRMVATSEETPLTASEKSSPLAWTPVQDHLLNWNFEKGAALVEVNQRIAYERWEDTEDNHLAYQELAAIFIHRKGNLNEVWAKLEFKPWMKPHLEGISDQDGDGFPEAYVRLSSKVFSKELIEEISGPYMTRKLNKEEVKEWANTLASLWYPTYNTDVLDLLGIGEFPLPDTDEEVRKELGGMVISQPISVFRGRPFNTAIYNVFVVDGIGGETVARAATPSTGTTKVRRLDGALPVQLRNIKGDLNSELGLYGNGSWTTWRNSVSPFLLGAESLATSHPPEIMGLQGRNGFLVFRRELDYLQAGDLEQSPAGKDPVEAIVSLKKRLAQDGIDFLFVPIPTKQDIYPEIVSEEISKLPGQIAQPYIRKLMLDLAEAGVETVDLFKPFQRAKKSAEEGKKLLYQRQDTHWTPEGLELAATIVSTRLKSYNWYAEEFSEPVRYTTRDTTIAQRGDIHSRLPASLQVSLGSETLICNQVLNPEEELYEDSPESPVLLLGDSYMGVFQLVAPRHAGFSSHVAKNLGGPVDLIMGWGGGPEAPQKLAARGKEYLDNKRIVVWLVSARDLFAYNGAWSVTEL